jgi:adenylosuccinate synthase
VDILAAEADVCARCAGGNNAGHTIVATIGPNNVKTTFDFHLLPSGLFILSKRGSQLIITRQDLSIQTALVS